ncbi:hypothetical protein [Candidatus Borrarchaeum sp.]|uniref:hypothetical protein n=1 Tax=Candidatus Borrarchaeum sp. TaxID=2846742 RepID=UPI0025809240|nr:hypothetical protein [Candidatus Borrarchaeum sp.]
MSKNTKTPFPALKRGLPWELKCKFAQGQLTTLFKGIMNEIREKYDAVAALEIAEKTWKREDRVKNMVKTLKDVFKIEGNDMEAMNKWWNIYWELTGVEATYLELSETYTKTKITNCPWSTTDPKDICNWCTIYSNIIEKAMNPKATIKRLKGMCAGDQYCEFFTKIEE